MSREQQDLIAALAAASVLGRKLEVGVPALIATDGFRDSLADLCDRLERRLDEISEAT